MSLHHVKRIKGRAPQVGDLLARKGSWDRKYRILHIGPGVKEDEYNTAFTVTAEYLGRYYADGTCVPVKRPSKRDFEMVHASGGFTPGYYIRWHEICEEI